MDDVFYSIATPSVASGIRCLLSRSLQGLDFPEGSRRFYTDWVVCMAIANMCQLDIAAHLLREAGVIRLLHRAARKRHSDERLKHFSLVGLSFLARSPSQIFGIGVSCLPLRNGIPSILDESFQYLYEKEGFLCSGLFRIAGDEHVVWAMRKELDAANPNWISLAKSCHDITSLLKMFFSELPESLWTEELYLRFISLSLLENTNRRVKELRNLTLKLPTINRTILARLIRFLCYASCFEDVNRMDDTSLAVVIGPCLVSRANVLQHLSHAIEIITTMLQNFDKIFENYVRLPYERVLL
eukprot:c1005_g1_i1.p1 GENE.c1005_g1_i1~~c1005_g1_i1.p1  ORF type:complete len:299 (+),score=58.56 c1005_g1_i1:723-1619(+)